MADTQSLKEKREERKSEVRVLLTYAAALFLFGISLMLIIWFMYIKDYDKATAAFGTVVPTTTFIIGYWFAKRSAERQEPEMPEEMRTLVAPSPPDGGQGGQAEAQQGKAGEDRGDK
ncbi:MAG: hypothetical protein OXQ29_15145 [Rhodospirillaceae bacterium]|nr:hypothetical protein [Rhodospirillaceae bacterium]